MLSAVKRLTFGTRPRVPLTAMFKKQGTFVAAPPHYRWGDWMPSAPDVTPPETTKDDRTISRGSYNKNMFVLCVFLLSRHRSAYMPLPSPKNKQQALSRRVLSRTERAFEKQQRGAKNQHHVLVPWELQYSRRRRKHTYAPTATPFKNDPPPPPRAPFPPTYGATPCPCNQP